MTNWGYLLLALFVALGVSRRSTWRTASRRATAVAALIAFAVFAYYGALR